ncbi:hypothetical protein DAPPUDRAFT_94545 [Daphnia pulex]|uniref:Uncharacterized protein n=1 Tax=Daphnia pulex TaxID=6669 RepID=E9FSC2_DAPPU|nr:hypothetical protein DAPPUDRAFT_117151 [Daphnia pulex]EFX89184.1 hypothetical protein DAPPUDRAFT_94545 [Daphnia pulex]|eukprot:EFX65542.1 hypothetical protein DAPPUDRAFT_117151 [Daphnia pulex]
MASNRHKDDRKFTSKRGKNAKRQTGSSTRCHLAKTQNLRKNPVVANMPLAVEKPTPECSHSRHTIQLANCVPTSIDRFKFQEVVLQDGKPFEIHVHVVNDAHTNTSSRSEKNFAKRNHKYLIYVSTSVHISSRKYAKFPVYQIGIVEKGHRVIQKSCQKVKVIGITLRTTSFDCKWYEEYLRLLLEMVQMTKVEGKLIGVMEFYLKPLDRNRIETRSRTKQQMGRDFFSIYHTFTRGRRLW